jgi:hypothetical protein
MVRRPANGVVFTAIFLETFRPPREKTVPAGSVAPHFLEIEIGKLSFAW